MLGGSARVVPGSIRAAKKARAARQQQRQSNDRQTAPQRDAKASLVFSGNSRLDMHLTQLLTDLVPPAQGHQKRKRRKRRVPSQLLPKAVAGQHSVGTQTLNVFANVEHRVCVLQTLLADSHIRIARQVKQLDQCTELLAETNTHVDRVTEQLQQRMQTEEQLRANLKFRETKERELRKELARRETAEHALRAELAEASAGAACSLERERALRSKVASQAKDLERARGRFARLRSVVLCETAHSKDKNTTENDEELH